MRETENFSMYSDISMRTSALSSPNMASASALQSSVLPTPVGPRNRNEPMGRLHVLEPRSRPADRAGDGADRFVLPDDPLMQQSLPGAADGRIRPRVSCVTGICRPRSHDLRDLFCTDLTLRCGAAILPGFALGLHVGTNGALFIANLCCALKVLMRDGLFLFLVELLNLGFQLLHVRRRGEGTNAHAGGSFVDQVNGLIRQVAVGDVAVGKLSRRLQSPRR